MLRYSDIDSEIYIQWEVIYISADRWRYINMPKNSILNSFKLYDLVMLG